jgi:hypothetical protein
MTMTRLRLISSIWKTATTGSTSRTTLISARCDKPYPFQVSTISATETELLRLRYNTQPKHTVIHKGACSFTGIETSAKHGSSQSTRGHSGLTVQVNVDDL